MLRRRALSVLLLGGAGALLQACGSYRPLYGKSQSNGEIPAVLANIAVDEQKTRSGQLLRNELLSSFRSGQGGEAYVLRMEISEKTQNISSLAFEKVNRYRYRMNVTYKLVEAKSGAELEEGKSFSQVSYDTVQEPVADLRAAENARERAARELAQDIRLRISAFLARSSG
jgi:LPS-assembly lipoprotein